MSDQNFFTVALSEYNEDFVTLLFNRDQPKPLNPVELQREFLQHEVLRRTCESGILVTPPASAKEFEITTCVDPYLVPDTYTDRHNATIFIANENRAFQELNMWECFEDCKLPHKTMLSCIECLDMDTVTECPAKKFYLETQAIRERLGPSVETEYTHPETFQHLFKNRKSQLAGSTYISPILTAPTRIWGSGWHEKIPPYMVPLRKPEFHHFDQIEHWSRIRSGAVKERARRRQFRAQACPQCLVQKECHDACEEWWIHGCDGPYDKSETQAVEEILGAYEISYEPQLLANLISHYAGPIPFRVDQKCAHLSCSTASHDNRFQFGIVFDYKGDYWTLSDTELHALLKKWEGKQWQGVRTPQPASLLSNKERAILLELAARHSSPRCQCGWHKSPYSSLYIERQYPGRLALKFRWGSRFVYHRGGPYRESWTEDRGWELPWSVSARTLGDIYSHYGNFCTLKKTKHPLRRSAKWET